jgi:hypothetical protein
VEVLHVVVVGARRRLARIGADEQEYSVGLAMTFSLTQKGRDVNWTYRDAML